MSVTLVKRALAEFYRAKAMSADGQLLILKAVHTGVVFLSASATCYILYCGIKNRLGFWLWMALAYVVLIGVGLVANGGMCPLQNLARAIMGADRWVPDLFMPNWVANLIVPVLAPLDAIGAILVIWRLLQRRRSTPQA